MPDVGYFGPLPQARSFGIEGFDYDKFKLWIESVEWNFKRTFTVQGDIISANWDGVTPLDLSSIDTTATAGFAFDTTEGSGQLEGDFFVGGLIEVGDPTDATVRLDGSTGKVEWTVVDTDPPDDNAYFAQSIIDQGSGIYSAVLELSGFAWDSASPRPSIKLRSGNNSSPAVSYSEFAIEFGGTEVFELYEASSGYDRIIEIAGDTLLDVYGDIRTDGNMIFWNSFGNVGGEIYAFNSNGREIVIIKAGDDVLANESRIQVYGSGDSSGPGDIDLISDGEGVVLRWDESATELLLNADVRGTGLAWQTWTPTWTNISVGNGTVTAYYVQIGETVHGYCELVFGSTTSISSANNGFSPPVTIGGVYNGTVSPIGTASYFENGVASYMGLVRVESTTRIRPITQGTNNGLVAAMSATAPFTWGTGDVFACSFTYKAA